MSKLKGVDRKGIEWEERELYGKMIDISGRRFKKLVALLPVTSDNQKKWLCRCDCGNEFVTTYNKLSTGNTKSCGCLLGEISAEHWKQFRKEQQYIGKKYGRLTVMDFVGIKNYEALYRFKCDCGNIIINTLHKVKQGNTKSCGCLKQDNVDKYKIDIIGQKFGHLLVTAYVGLNSHQNTIFECLCDCGETTIVSRNSLTTGHTQSCGCLTSVGENNIKQMLNQTEFKYKQQYVFDDLKSKLERPLPYDFAIIDDNNQVIRLIEFDGEQHKHPVDIFGGEDRFKKQQENDELKNQYALSHNIPLVRIPYSKRDTMTLDDLLGDKYLFIKQY